MLEPEDLIKAFDEILEYVYGRSKGRDNPHSGDRATAEGWIDQGITLPIACAVFYHRMSVLHEKWLRNFNPKDRANIPHSLKIFDENIQTAIRKVASGSEPLEVWEQADNQWRNRITSWLKGKPWYENIWGPAPYDPGCRAPPSILKELLPHLKPDGVGKMLSVG